MKNFQKFQNVESNPFQDSAKVLISTKYVSKGYTLGDKFD